MSANKLMNLAVAGALTVALAACGASGGGSDSTATTTKAPTTTTAKATTTTEAPASDDTTTTEADTDAAPSSLEDFGEDISDEGEAYTDFVEISDDSGALVVEVPKAWSDVSGAPTANGDPSLQAAPDRNGDVATTPILGFTAVEYTTPPDLDNVIEQTASATTGGDCDPQPMADYQDGVFSGRIQTFTNCGGDDRAWLFVAATPDNGDEYVTVIFGNAVSVADVNAIQHAFNTFNTTI